MTYTIFGMYITFVLFDCSMVYAALGLLYTCLYDSLYVYKVCIYAFPDTQEGNNKKDLMRICEMKNHLSQNFLLFYCRFLCAISVRHPNNELNRNVVLTFILLFFHFLLFFFFSFGLWFFVLSFFEADTNIISYSTFSYSSSSRYMILVSSLLCSFIYSCIFCGTWHCSFIIKAFREGDEVEQL